MKKPTLIIVLIFIVVAAIMYLRSILIVPNINNVFSDIRKDAQPKFDSLSRSIAKENGIYKSISILIQKNHLDSANHLVDSALEKNPMNELNHTYKGMIYDAQGNFDSAIGQYDIAMMHNIFPVGLDKRAKTFIKIKQFNNAIEDYKAAYEINYIYSVRLAEVYDMTNQRDSAIRYYKIYLSYYPNDSLVKSRLASIK